MPTASDTRDYRLGFGWDSGLAMRYRFRGPWGLGVRVDPGWSGSDWDSFTRYDASADSQGNTQDDDAEKVWASVMLYAEAPVGKWFGVGPYVDLSYGRAKSESESDYLNVREYPYLQTVAVYHDDFEHVSEAWTLAVGVRPTLTIKKRFALESRFGLAVAHESRERRSDGVRRDLRNGEESARSASSEDSDDNELSVYAYGEGLGPGATLRFIVYF